eukprot:4096982-Amphidinium_carterae.1
MGRCGGFHVRLSIVLARPPVAAARSRVVLEIFADDDALPHIAQVGIAQLRNLEGEEAHRCGSASQTSITKSITD